MKSKSSQAHRLNYWPECLGLGLLGILVLYYAIFNHSIQIFDYDMIEQNVHFIVRGYDLIHTKGFTFWDWSNFMGTSVTSYVYYFLFSPFWLLYAMLPSKEWIPYAFIYVGYLKYGLLFLFSCLYFRKIRTHNLSVFIGSSMLTFSGFAMGYYNYNHFVDVYLFVPLALYFTEVYLQDHRFKGFALTIMAMSIINGYLLYLFTLYFFIYYIFRYFTIHTFGFKTFLTAFFGYFGLYLLGLGMGSIGFIPGILSMLGTSRLTLDTHLFNMISFKDAFRYFTAMFQPIVDRTNFNPLVNVHLVPSYGWSGGAALYSLIITPLFFPQYFQLRIQRKEKWLVSILFLLFGLIAVFPNLYFFLQGNKDTRWMVIFTFILSYVISRVLDDFSHINRPLLLASSIITGVILVGSYYASKGLGVQNDPIYYSIAKRNILFLLAIVALYTAAFILIRETRLRTVLISTLVFMEVLLIMYNLFLNPVGSTSMTYDKFLKYEITDTKIIDSIKDNDSNVYRIDGIVDGGFNDPVSKNYLGFTFYSSVYNYKVDPFIQGNIASAGGWVVGGNAGKSLFKNLFGAKYWFDDSEFYLNAPFGYLYDHTVKINTRKVDVYRNQYPIPLVRIVKDELSFDVWSALSALDKTRALMSYAVVQDSPSKSIEFIDQIEKLADFSTSHELSFDEPQKEAVIYIVTPRSDEVRMSVYLDDKLVDKHYSYEPQYTSIYIDRPFDRIVVEVTNLYGVPDAEFTNSLYLDHPKNYYPSWYESNQAGFVNNFEISQNAFSGTIESDQSRWVVTSIAYDDNWTLWVDGEKVKLENVNGGFLGFKVDAGIHEFKGTYFPKILIPSLSITILSVFGFILLIRGRNG